MIKKLQRKFIMISGLAVVIVMLCLLLPVNLVNRIRLRNELKKTISFIMESGGDLSEFVGDGGRSSMAWAIGELFDIAGTGA